MPSSLNFRLLGLEKISKVACFSELFWVLYDIYNLVQLLSYLHIITHISSSSKTYKTLGVIS